MCRVVTDVAAAVVVVQSRKRGSDRNRNPVTATSVILAFFLSIAGVAKCGIGANATAQRPITIWNVIAIDCCLLSRHRYLYLSINPFSVEWTSITPPSLTREYPPPSSPFPPFPIKEIILLCSGPAVSAAVAVAVALFMTDTLPYGVIRYKSYVSFFCCCWLFSFFSPLR